MHLKDMFLMAPLTRFNNQFLGRQCQNIHIRIYCYSTDTPTLHVRHILQPFNKKPQQSAILVGFEHTLKSLRHLTNGSSLCYMFVAHVTSEISTGYSKISSIRTLYTFWYCVGRLLKNFGMGSFQYGKFESVEKFILKTLRMYYRRNYFLIGLKANLYFPK